MTTEQIEAKVVQRVKDELTAESMDERYKEMIDEVYSFESVGGIFAGMSPARVLEEMDPTAFRCGFNDFIDSESRDSGLEEIEEEFYQASEVQEIRDEVEAEEDGDDGEDKKDG